ncbi:hypothetical protein AFM16_12255 [Streptomyces antibioticus]|uniref:Secreted protein n=1 Tax=Streptomyces antibioticus TaxID=1890 RepID=A0ABX3LRK7_STRAT|nr:hypothetical protein AFM16_12255 [Streptomyces antibioticus]
MQRRSGTWRKTFVVSSVAANSAASVRCSMFQSVRNARTILRMWRGVCSPIVSVMRYCVATGDA